jgi:hypothetical protein
MSVVASSDADRLGTAPDEMQKATMDHKNRYVRIQQKEDDLRRREAQLRKANLAVNESRPPSFPWCYPVMHHDIAEEILIVSQMFLRVWLANLVGLWVTAVANGTECCHADKFQLDHYSLAWKIIFSIVVGVLTVPLGFRVSDMRIYRECAESNVGFVTLGFAALFFVWITIGVVGIPNSGMVSAIMGVDGIGGDGTFTKVIARITFVLYVLGALLQFFLHGKLMLLFKASGQQLQPVPVPNETKSLIPHLH